MRLIDLVDGTKEIMQTVALNGHSDVEIAGLTCDSRDVRPGYLFAALRGETLDGGDYIPDAIDRGAACVLSCDAISSASGTPWIVDANPRHRFAMLAARFYSPQPETVVAITGTNGKTSVASFTQQIWATLGIKSASIGTLGVHGVGIDEDGSLTTPDAVRLHQTLNKLAADGIDHVAIEASSHGLAQARLDGVVLKAGAFTNISHDHLDYHANMDEYFGAKLALFSDRIQPGGVAVVHVERPESETVQEVCRKRGLKIITCGKNASDVRLVDRQMTGASQRLVLQVLNERFEITLPLAGSFQADNALVALGLVIAMGAPVAKSVAALESLEPVAGRMQFVGSVNAAGVYVDYAHTPEALETALANLRPHTEGKLSVVFGAGGDRDPGKRAPMGKAAMQGADRVIVTDDNPRSEDPTAIRAQVLHGAPGAHEIGNRREAIRTAVAELGNGDVLLVAGKGHEQGQIVGGEILPFDDAGEILSAISQAEAVQ